jgi:hypothetical protein
VRYLAQAGLVTRAREPGARSDHYRVGKDPWYEAIVVRTALLRRWEEALGEGAELLGTDRPAGRRLRETQEFLAFMRGELPVMLDRWRDRREALRDEG